MMPVADRFLKPGDVVGVAAPSSRFDSEELNRGILRLEAMGFQVKVAEEIYETKRYLAGSDEQRVEVLTRLFEDPQVRAVIAARGGYGAMRLLPLLHWPGLRANTTVFIGFSDATALISCLVSRAGMTAVHGPNLVSLARAGERTLLGFEQAVTGRLSDLGMDRDLSLIPGRARGKLVGGNLATLVHLIGTKFQPDFTGGILFLEDVGEPAYKIDRMLTQMKLAGLFNRIRGVVLGEFHGCANAEYLPEIITETFAPFEVPVQMGLPAGHGDLNLAFPMGLPVILDTDAATLTWEN